MNTEEGTQTTLAADELSFDAHEFDGLRDEIESTAETLLRRVNAFVKTNPWLCLGIAAAVGATAAFVIARTACSKTRDTEIEKNS